VGELPLVIYLNHASWWDPLMGLLLAQHFWPSRKHFAPIDAAALDRYKILSRIGFFGVEANTRRGAATFIRNSVEILEAPATAIWITGEGKFCDPRTRPVVLRAGLAHLARRVRPAAFVPLAIEYPFWEERFPEVLCRFGSPVAAPAENSVAMWTTQLAEAMQMNQDALAGESIARCPERFKTILAGRSGVGAVYDGWRWAVAKLRGEGFSREHGNYSP
jgi:1-acyl-sn-glycerol-3-phosphate acyltransferase